MAKYVASGSVIDPADDSLGGDVDCDLWSTTGPRFKEWGGTLRGELKWSVLRTSDRVLLVIDGRTGRILISRIGDSLDRAEITGLGSPPF